MKPEEAFERLGVTQAVEYTTKLLRSGDGVEKHGEQGWRKLTDAQLWDKTQAHLRCHGPQNKTDKDSGMYAVAHVAVRALQLLQRTLERNVSVTVLSSWRKQALDYRKGEEVTIVLGGRKMRGTVYPVKEERNGNE